MSFMNRQRVRQRMNNRITSSPSTPNLMIPSIEESLQNWLTRDSSSSTLSWLLDSCRCCNKPHCENLETFVYAIRKLEDDARLAAEIGQSLLHKHEQHVIESNEIKSRLEEQLFQNQERVLELEQLLSQSDTIKRSLEQEKNKVAWEWQKTQKALDETMADVEACNQRSNQLANELNIKKREVEKLQTCKLMARQADLREEDLRSSLEDIKQELATSRKAELSLESKYKKLKSKYDALSKERQKGEQEKENMEDEGVNMNMDSHLIKEPNEKLRKDINKHLTSALLFPDNKIHPPVENNDHLFELVKELVSTNNKLKMDLLENRDLLLESRNESMNLLAKLEQEEKNKELEYDDDDTMTEQQDIWPKESKSNSTFNSIEPSAIVHHHYHYHVQDKKDPDTSPCRQLYDQICLVQERLQQADTRALNRKLHKAFDILELSSMSNSIIENILVTEINDLSKSITLADEEFLLLIQVVQAILKEVVQLRININDLQVEYVKKVEENEARIEQEIQKKQRQPKKITALTWLSSVFQKSASSQKAYSTHHSHPSLPPTTAIYVHTLCPAAILIPSNPHSILTEDYSTKTIRCNGPSSSYPTRSPCNKKRLAVNYPLRASQSATTTQKQATVKKKRSSLGLNSTDATSWLGNKINQ